MRIKLSGTKKLTVLALLLALGLVLNLVESMIPVFTVLPGAKIGLANVVTMLCLVWFGPAVALGMGILRAVLTGLLSGMVTMGLYGGAGTIFSIAAMWISAKMLKEKISMAGLSMLGAFFYNVGQVAAFAAVVESIELFRYLPVLTLISTVSGLFVGVVAGKISEKRMVGE